MQRQPHLGLNAAAIATFNRRVRAWWVICSLLAIAFFSPTLTVVLVRLDELLGTARVHHAHAHAAGRSSGAVLGVLLLHAAAVRAGGPTTTTTLYSILIPVYAFLFIPARIAIAGDFKRFLERMAKIQSGLLICVYCLSFAPALLYLEMPRI